MTMLRDNKDSGAERQLSSHNVLGEPPEICSMRPMTGFYRDGCCKYRTRRCWQSYGLRRDDKRVSRFFKIARQRSFDPGTGTWFSGPETRLVLVCAPLAGGIRNHAPVLRERGCLVLLLTRRSQTPSH